MPDPLVSIIIPNYNGADLLPACLDALRAQTLRDFEIVVVDDGSTDDSLAALARYPEARVIKISNGHRFARVANIGLRHSKGRLLALLNNDTAADPRWLAQLVGGLARNSWASFATSKLVLFDQPGVLHSTGDYFGADGLPNSRGVWQQDTGQYEREEEVFGAQGAAALYKREMLAALAGERVGRLGPVFDPKFVMYCEDVDLNLRARLAGFRCVYVPTAVVRHKLSATGGGTLASYFVARNFYYLWAKDFPGAILRRNAGRIARRQLLFFFDSLRHIREKAARARLRGQLAGLITWPRMLPSRRKILGPAANRRELDRWIPNGPTSADEK